MTRLIQFLHGRLGLMGVLISLPLLANGQQVIQVANVGSQQPESQHVIDPALEIARASLLNVQANVDDYKALFVKRTRVDGVLPPLQYARVKIRNRKVRNGTVVTPMGVYLDFLKPADVKGREVIWLEGANDGNLVVHKGGMARFVTLRLDPNGYLAMRGQRYPISDIGIENLLNKIIETCERDRQYDECDVQIFRNAKVGGTVCTMVQVKHPVKRDHFDFHKARVYFSDSLNMPIRYKSWTWPTTPDGKPVIQEEYNYMKLELNVGLTDQDFDPDNPHYRYR
jgi:hypothetical protein